jgi:hypothetical protein
MTFVRCGKATIVFWVGIASTALVVYLRGRNCLRKTQFVASRIQSAIDDEDDLVDFRTRNYDEEGAPEIGTTRVAPQYRR